MIRQPSPYRANAPVVVIDIGNTFTGIATWWKGDLKTPLSVPTDDERAFAEAFAAHTDAAPKGRPAAVVIGSVVPTALEHARTYVAKRREQDALVIGETIPLPIDVDVTDTRAIGVDRVCAAAAVYDKLQTGCTVIDFGTAVTIDLIDDAGTLLGGAILPGLKMQLHALHEHTAVLPEVEPAMPELPYGRSTTEAIQTGVCRGLAGAVRALVEAYAEYLNRWPQVVATGGDLAFIAPYCDFLDAQVQHLTLRGIGVAYAKHLKDRGA
ncbi:MAG: type III pantothenate kinase [Phycisphaerae bacterium]